MQLSTLAHTWILDIDGTLLKHNGYKIDGRDSLLDGVKEFFAKIPANDKIILLTAREEKYIKNLKAFLKENGLRYDYLLCEIPMGERILINDKKPSGLKTAYAVNKNRDEKLEISYEIREDL